jgi:hypothetical protein
VTDSRLFNETLQEANAQLPYHVAAVVICEPLYEIPFGVNPDPSVHFPQLKMRSGSFMEAELYRELALEDGYLRVDGTLIIWQPDYSYLSLSFILIILLLKLHISCIPK